MKVPKGLKTFKKLAKIPVFIEGKKGQISTVEIPEIEHVVDIILEMAEALEYVARGPRPDDSDSKVASDALKKYKEWK